MTAVPVSGPVASEVRAVLDAPRGRRFSKPVYPAPLTREQRLLAQMQGNPRVAYRQAHGVLPAWMHIQAARMAERDAQNPRAVQNPQDPGKQPTPRPGRPPLPSLPRPRPAPDDGPLRPRPERPPLPRRRSPRPHGHRKPTRLGRRTAWGLCCYTLAALAGALAHHLASGLL